MVPTQLAWRQLLKKLMAALSSMEARLGYQMHLSRRSPCSISMIPLICWRNSDIFVIWARCKWDGKVRGFLLEKASILFLVLLIYLTPTQLVGSERFGSAGHKE